jgi:hypothetical protein
MSRGSFEMLVNEMEKTTLYRSGWLLTKEEVEYFTELIRSPYIAEIVEPKYWAVDSFENVAEGVPVVPVLQKMILMQDSIELFTEDDYTYALEFKMRAENEIAWSNIPARSEIAYDTYLEFQVKVTEVGQFLKWYDSEADAMRVYVNNTYVDDIQYNFNQLGWHTVKIYAWNMTKLWLDTINMYIQFVNIETFTIHRVQLYNFNVMTDRYLNRRVATWQNLGELKIDGAGYNEIEELAMNLVSLFKKYGVLASVYIPSSPVNPVTQNIKEYFDSVSVTCTLF